MKDKIDTTCPCCATKLVVDVATGEVLSEERPKVDHEKSFENAWSDVRGGEQKRADAFDKAFDRTQRMDDLLSKKFEEAKKKAEREPGKKPRGPFDLD